LGHLACLNDNDMTLPEIRAMHEPASAAYQPEAASGERKQKCEEQQEPAYQHGASAAKSADKARWVKWVE
jgi:hypothetical protein